MHPLWKTMIGQNIPLNASSLENHDWTKHPTLIDLKELDSWVKNHVSSF